MEPSTILFLTVFLLLFLIGMRMPIAFALALSGSLGIVLLEDWATLLYSLGTFPVSRIATFNWVVIPLFVLMGNFAEASGIAADAYDLANKWLSRIKGNLVLVTIATCGLLGATTGSGATGTAIMGKIAVPEMRRHGYDMKLATGAAASAGTVGILIPPSGSLVIIGVLAELSIGKLFLAGILPGILSVLVFMAMVNVRCILNPKLAPLGQKYSWKEKFSSLGQAWGVALIFLTIIGGLYSGIVTAIEVAALGCFVSLIMVFHAIAGGKSDWAAVWKAVMDTVALCAMIFAFIIGAGIFSLFVTLSGIIPQTIAFVENLAVSKGFILATICLLYVPLGMFFDPLSMVLVTVPIVYPVLINGLGYDPIWFSIILVKLVELSCITPPVGLNLFIMKGVYPEASLGDITRGCGWFMIMDVMTVLILVAFPWIVTWIPSTM